ncbi:MAG: hypothetical protein IT438_02635 [Phycisphaerales bacterium]|nr:hypothetical protein [Phycisphaerales bacterium]
MAAKPAKSAALPAVFVGGVAAFSAASAAVKSEDGVVRRRFVKDLIRAGTWYKGDTAHQVPRERLDHWAATFGKMTEAGVKVPLPLGHTTDPERNRGYAVGMFVDDTDGTPTLKAEVELIGDDALSLANRTEVSICAEPKLKAGNGAEFTDAITHIALVTDPVIPKQGGFIPLPLAASRGGGTVDAPCFTMAQFSQESNMDWKALASALGINAEGLDDKTGPEAVLAAIKKLKGGDEEHAQAMAASRKEVETANARIKALEAGKAPEVPADVLDMSADATAARIDTLTPKIGPEAVKRFKGLLCGEAGKRNPLCLSRTAATAAGLPDSISKLVIDALGEVVAGPATGGKAGTQAFSRNVPGDKSNGGKSGADRLAELDPELNKKY